MQITMNLQYAAGHTGTFEMAYSCGGTTEDDLSKVRRMHSRLYSSRLYSSRLAQ